MKTVVIIHTILISYIIIKPYMERITIHIDKTFWRKKAYGFHITIWDHKKGIIPNNGKIIFRFNWKNPDKINDNIKIGNITNLK